MSNREYLSHDELQHIEYSNKVLNEHLETVNVVCSLSEEKIQHLLSGLNDYLAALKAIQYEMGQVVNNIYKSSRELKQAVGNPQEITTYVEAVNKLDKLLDDKLIQKLRRISGLPSE